MMNSRIRWQILALLATAPALSLAGKPVASLVGKFQTEQPNRQKALMKDVKKSFKVPFYFVVPNASYMPLTDETLQSRGTEHARPVVLFNYDYTNPNSAPETHMGLRMAVVDASRPRAETSATLAESGLIETGDIILSYRAEWYQTLRYSHIQLGISHAGVAYVDRDRDGKNYVYNLDMPLNEDTVGADKKSKLSAKHYREAPLLHILRPRGLTPAQKENLLAWARLIARQAPSAYGSKIVFNSDYAAPKFTRGQPLTFVADVARIALGQPIRSQLSVYCSEFAWSLLSLKDCSPTADAAAFAGTDAPTCIRPTFDPMPVLGTLPMAQGRDEIRSSTQTIGMADGPIVLADTLIGPNDTVQERNALIRRLFSQASGNAVHISSGHRAVEDAIMAQNPQFYAMLERYYQLSGMPGASAAPEFRAMMTGFNASQRENYSPTAFQVHALLSPDAAIKAFDYVATIAYIESGKYKKILSAARAFHR